MLVDQDGKPLSKKELKYLPNFLGIVSVVTKKSVVETNEPLEPYFIMFMLVTPQKMELYSQAGSLLQEVILHNLLDSYVKKEYGKELKEMDEKEAQKMLSEFLRKYQVNIQPQPIPLDFVVLENIDEEELKKLVEQEKLKSGFLVSGNEQG
ncbi:hypothetical protein YS40_044 [Thermus phage phiYS40]|uniref:hypothetical protein n=1 Tax=Thermus phage phiYS40 TaxID=407392 RepID=UPI0000E689A2|nr:hypothetical protein YS40_044 [Thermus phage phiYS40]ABJ91438.1 hypothetical protein YS40_044 [Thermus phage phiYS40]BAK53562.1 hypothetical protein YSP_044 [Thermus phage phiYS40]